MKGDRQRRWYRSTRLRITAPATLIVAAVVGVGSIFLVQSVKDNQLSQIDAILSGTAQYTKHEMASLAALRPMSPKGLYGQMFTANGRLLGSSSNLDRSGPLASVSGVTSGGRFVTVESPHNGELRVYEVKLGTGNAPILVDGISMAGVSAETSSLATRLSIVAPLLVLVVAALIWFVVGRAMRPVDRVRRKASDISDSNLNERIANPGTGDEVEQLVTTLNALLSRLEGTLERERRLVADASHEFRSPLAAIRVNVEAEMAQTPEPSDSQRAVLRGVLRLQELADQLLVLEQSTRSDATVPAPVDLDELVLSEIESVASARDIVIIASEVSGGQVVGQELDFSRIVEQFDLKCPAPRARQLLPSGSARPIATSNSSWATMGSACQPRTVTTSSSPSFEPTGTGDANRVERVSASRSWQNSSRNTTETFESNAIRCWGELGSLSAFRPRTSTPRGGHTPSRNSPTRERINCHRSRPDGKWPSRSLRRGLRRGSELLGTVVTRARRVLRPQNRPVPILAHHSPAIRPTISARWSC